jgi:hypothetical protein
VKFSCASKWIALDQRLTCPTLLPPPPQHATGRKGLFRTLLVEQKPLSVKHDFKPKATAKENQPPEACLQDPTHSVRAMPALFLSWCIVSLV